MHASDNLLTITVTFLGETISILQKNEKIGFEEVMPLQSFDDYCIVGYFFVAVKDFLLEDDEAFKSIPYLVAVICSTSERRRSAKQASAAADAASPIKLAATRDNLQKNIQKLIQKTCAS
jgi:hypothetical protein